MCSLHGHFDILPRGKLLQKYTAFQERHWVLFIGVIQSLSHVQLFAIHGLQCARFPCPSPSPSSRVCSHLCPLGWWWHSTISSSVVPFSSCLQSFPTSGSFPLTHIFESGGQSTGVSALASFFPKKSQGWSLSEWTGWIFLQSKGLFFTTTVRKHQFFGNQPSLWFNPYIHVWLLEKP